MFVTGSYESLYRVGLGANGSYMMLQMIEGFMFHWYQIV